MYAFGNPVNNTDPTGHKTCVDDLADCNNPDYTPDPNYILKSNDNNGGSDRGGKKGNQPTSGSNSNDCPYGWVSAALTPDGSCGSVTVNGNAIVDPFAWEHIAGATLGGVVTIGLGVVMIYVGASVCTTVAGCVAGVPLIAAGVLAIPVGGVMIYSGYKFGQIYLDDIFVVTH